MKNPSLTDKELADALYNQFKNTELAKEQKLSGEIKSSDFPHDISLEHKPMYSKFLICARNGKNKYNNTMARVKSLQRNNLFGKNITIHTFYGSKKSLEEQKKMVDSRIESKEIGNIVVRKLKKYDQIAYLRFASVYRQFADIEEFKKELQKL